MCPVVILPSTDILSIHTHDLQNKCLRYCPERVGNNVLSLALSNAPSSSRESELHLQEVFLACFFFSREGEKKIQIS